VVRRRKEGGSREKGKEGGRRNASVVTFRLTPEGSRSFPELWSREEEGGREQGEGRKEGGHPWSR
jgi:hypothetical protein